MRGARVVVAGFESKVVPTRVGARGRGGRAAEDCRHRLATDGADRGRDDDTGRYHVDGQSARGPVAFRWETRGFDRRRWSARRHGFARFG